MRVFAISDLHLDHTNSKPMDKFGDVWAGQEDKILQSSDQLSVNEKDVLVVAGDISWAMKLADALADFEFFKNFPCKVLIVRGNHDYWWQSVSNVRDAIPSNVIAIQNDAVKIGGIVFCGTRGWNVPETGRKQSVDDKKIYDREVIRLGLTIESAKKLQTSGEKIVLIMHYPPFNNKREDNEFLKMIRESGIETVIFGHLHGKWHKCEYKTKIDNTDFYLTSCDFLQNQIVEIAVN